MIQLNAYHDEDGVDTTLSDSGCDKLHHRSIAKMDMEVSGSWDLQTVKLLERHVLSYWKKQMAGNQ